MDLYTSIRISTSVRLKGDEPFYLPALPAQHPMAYSRTHGTQVDTLQVRTDLAGTITDVRAEGFREKQDGKIGKARASYVLILSEEVPAALVVAIRRDVQARLAEMQAEATTRTAVGA